MRVISKRLNVHQFSANEWAILCDAENILTQIQNAYAEGTVLTNPVTGEVVEVDELRRVRGILDFLTTTMVVDVEVKTNPS